MHNKQVKWLDRKAELARLERVSSRRGGGLVVLWGRRRVGKTRLLLEWVHRAGGVYFVADESSPAFQRRRLAEAIDTRLPGFGRVEYRDWGGLFERLARDARQAKLHGPIVIDELPYLVRGSPDLPATLQRFVDHEAKEARLVLALAGSSQRMMQGLVLGAESPLYGRAHEAFEVRPLPPEFLGDALGLRDPVATVRAFSVWGGLPRYWELASEWADLREAVDAIVLNPAGALHDEPSRLLLEELPPAMTLRPILDAIGSGAHRIPEIAGRIGSPTTALAGPMARLTGLGLVFRETPFGEPERSTKRALYRLSDPFLRLWFSLVAPKRALLAQVPKKARLALFDAREPHLVAACWEELCRAAVPQLGRELGADFGPAKRYWGGSGPEWDVVAETADGQALLVAEAKWSSARAAGASLLDAHAALVRKGLGPFGERRSVLRALFVPEMPRRSSSSLPADVRVIDARTVIAALSRVGD